MKTRKRLWTLIAITLIFVAPMLLARFVYHRASHWHLKSTNQGVLIKPAIKNFLPPSKAPTQPWSIVYIASQCCDELCQSSLHDVHQMRIASNRLEERSQSVLVQAETCAYKPNTDVRVVAASKVPLKQLLSLGIQAHRVVVDPLGNAILYYPHTSSSMAVFKDMKHLLRASQIG